MKKILILLAFLSIWVETAAYSSAQEAANQYPPPDKLCALTFDDGPSSDPELTPLVLDKLESHGVVATFFLVGQNVNDSTKEVMDHMVAGGHEIGNHSFGYDDMAEMSADQIRKSVDDTNRAIQNHAGVTPTFFRAPNLSTSTIMQSTIEMPFADGVVAGDWPGGGGDSTERIMAKLLPEIQDGTIILLHDVQPKPHPTPEALDTLIPELKKRGYQFVTVSELFERKGTRRGQKGGRAGEHFKECAICPEMVVIPPGTFMMGSPETEKNRDNDEGRHKVTIAYSFAVSKAPITWDQWEACVHDAMCDGQAVETALRIDKDGKPIKEYVDHGRGDRPVVGVSWRDAQAFVVWLNKKTGNEQYRLLSESEFEYAARAGTKTAYWWGDAPSHDYANYGKEVDLGGAAAGRDVWVDETSPVCSFPANGFGLCDMYGNVYQWIEDCYEADGTLLPADGSAVKSGNCDVRGFRANSFESNQKSLRSANRAFAYPPDTRGRPYLGFRVAKTLD